MSRILLDTGPSPRGWHRLEAFLRCPRLFALGYGRSGESPELAAANLARFPPTLPLVRGSIAHVGLAHLYARWAASIEGQDPEVFYRPHEAMRIVAEKYGSLGAELLGPVTELMKAYCARYPKETFKVVGVEKLLEMEFAGKFGGSPIQIPYTARADLIYEGRDGKVWICDHKCVAKVDSGSTLRYTLSGQFLGLQWLGFHHYGERFGGVVVNFLGMQGPTFHRKVLDPAPYALEKFPATVRMAEEGIARISEDVERGVETPGSFSEFTCMTPYGQCPAFHLCRFGT